MGVSRPLDHSSAIRLCRSLDCRHICVRHCTDRSRTRRNMFCPGAIGRDYCDWFERCMRIQPPLSSTTNLIEIGGQSDSYDRDHRQLRRNGRQGTDYTDSAHPIETIIYETEPTRSPMTLMTPLPMSASSMLRIPPISI